MYRTIKRLFAASAFLTLCSIASLYAGSQAAAGAPPPSAANPLAQIGGDPGDGWMLAGGLLMVVAMALCVAAAMLWFREKQGG
ncbi:MAG TPA: hypothetical protein VF668_04845 [Pyrinomonadaceae bacterium]|jgi:hypothetical protein